MTRYLSARGVSKRTPKMLQNALLQDWNCRCGQRNESCLVVCDACDGARLQTAVPRTEVLCTCGPLGWNLQSNIFTKIRNLLERESKVVEKHVERGDVWMKQKGLSGHNL